MTIHRSTAIPVDRVKLLMLNTLATTPIYTIGATFSSFTKKTDEIVCYTTCITTSIHI